MNFALDPQSYQSERKTKMTFNNPIKVYFESRAHAEVIAYFDSSEIYNLCLPALEAAAQDARMIVTEAVQEEEPAGELTPLIEVLKAAGECFQRHSLLSPNVSDQDRRDAIQRFSNWWNDQAVPLLQEYESS